MNIHRARHGTLCAGLALLLCACGGDPPPPEAHPTIAIAPVKPAPVTHAPQSIAKPGSRPGDIDRMITIANEDFAAQRFVSPPTANALEGFLEVRELDPDNSSVREAMVDLYPLATAAVRRAIDARDLVEAERVLALVERGMPGAMGVSELRTELDGLQQAQPGAGVANEGSPNIGDQTDSVTPEAATSALDASVADPREAPASDPAPPDASNTPRP